MEEGHRRDNGEQVDEMHEVERKEGKRERRTALFL